ncbi:MAG: DUF4159 domain-containing protein, partial [Thermoguttaceae bacterium]
MPIGRRHFLQRTGLLCAASTLGAVPRLGFGQDENSGPIDCGPPPKARPQSRTGGESFVPLPLPVTPLRRSEKKRPPSPPALIGKAALGEPRWITRDGQRTMYRDWMTDPADVDTLLKWTSEKLGISYRSIETDLATFSYDPTELPALLIAGHNQFEFGQDTRQALARYVADGGMILADACCGWNDFADSFRREMELIFPGRPLHKMLPEEPVFSSYYKLGSFTYKNGDGTEYQDAPC